MWYFSSPEIVFGEDALSHLAGLRGQVAMLVTDATLVRLGKAVQVLDLLAQTGMRVCMFDQVEPEPDADVVRQGAQALRECGADWIIALGGGSVIDAAKAMWVLYASPGTEVEGINPVDRYDLRRKARLAAVPTTSGTGSETTWAIVLSHPQERRKLGLGTREAVPDLAILDPALVADLPAQLTADSGLDALVHAVEGYTASFHNDFSDGLCLQAAGLVLRYLERAYRDPADSEARERMHNAAAIAGLGFGNAMAGLAHGLGHALGGVFSIPHGRAVGLFLPYTIEYTASGADVPTRYAELAYHLRLPCGSEREAAQALAEEFRRLCRSLGQPLSVQECGIAEDAYQQALPLLVANALNDTSTIMAARVPGSRDLGRLFEAAYFGSPVEF